MSVNVKFEYFKVSSGFVADADAVVQQFYPGELGGLALAEVIFGDVNPSGRVDLIGLVHPC